MILRAVVAACLLAPAFAALAQFEGTADVKMSAREHGHQMDGTGKLYLSSVGWRMEMESKIPDLTHPPGAGKAAPPRVHRMVVLGKMATPGKSYMLNDKTKTYAVMDEDDEKDANEPDDEKPWKVTKLGQDKVAGLSCTNVKATRESEEETYEACLAKDFISDAWLKAQSKDRDWWSDAARAGVTGYPVRMIARGPDGKEKHRMEIVKIERKKVPASMFEVPAGYKEASPMEMMAQDPEMQRQMQEAQRQMQEQMKNMSPEQRKMMEDMMKQHGGGQKR